MVVRVAVVDDVDVVSVAFVAVDSSVRVELSIGNVVIASAILTVESTPANAMNRIMYEAIRHGINFIYWQLLIFEGSLTTPYELRAVVGHN